MVALAAGDPMTGPAGTPPGVPRLKLLALGVAVLAVHVALLQTAPGTLNLREPVSTRQFITRSVAAPATAVGVAAPAAAKPATRPQAAPAPRAARPKPAQAIEGGFSTSSESNTPQVPVESTSIATNLVANETPASPPVSAASAPVTETPAAAVAAPAAPPAAPSAPVAVPASLRLQYNVSGEARRLQYTAQGELLFRHDGSGYEARAEISAFLFGARVQTSSGQLTPQGLAPTRFADKWRSEQAAHFDRERGRITFSANTPEAPLLSGAQDRLSVLVQLGALLAGDPLRYPAGTSITVQTAGPRDAENWQFTVAGPETVALPGGDTTTVKLNRAPRREFDQRVEVWLAPALGYLPARIRITQANGDFVDQQLRGSGPP